MDVLLCEDLNLKEDQTRLTRCTDYFRRIAEEGGTHDTESILHFLYDKWSAIRQECGKQIASVPSLVSHELSSVLCNTCNTTSHWQDIHGSILGLNALLTNADPEGNNELFREVTDICINFIGHVSIPVKEAVRQCLISAQKRKGNKYELVKHLVTIINTTVREPNHESEAISLKLDGLLGSLVDNYNLFPELMSPESSLHGLQEEQTENTSIDVVATIRLCALHPASTVRQKAGQILTSFVLCCLHRSSLASGSPTGVVRIITDMLVEALRSTESAHWRLQEISLMVAEKVVCSVIDAQLEKLEMLASQGSNASIPIEEMSVAESGILQHAFTFLDFLKNHLHVLLGHGQFEVRRMAIQLTPQLARAFVLLNAPVSVLDKDTSFVPISLALEGPTLDLDTALPLLSDLENMHNPSCATAESGDQIENNRISLGSRSDGSFGDADEGDCGALHVQLNSSFRSHAGAASGAGGGTGGDTGASNLDLDLISRTVWLNELIKENQHLFEAYSLTESWASSSATKDLQLRSYSIKDESHKHLAEVAVQRFASGANYHNPHLQANPCNRTGNTSVKANGIAVNVAAAAGGLARGVVDHWSLDVRGRLQEMEERVHFHRTVKALVSTEVTAESCTVIVLLVRNCRSVLRMVDDLLQAWETLFARRERWAAMTDFAASLNSLRSSANEAGTATLTVDFVESLALTESFLLSVQYRFSQCPDILAALQTAAAATADTDSLIDSAKTLQQRLGALRGDWICHIARIQCVSRCSTHVSTRSGISGQTHQRPSATTMLLTLLRQSHENAVCKNDLFSSLDHHQEEECHSDREDSEESNVLHFLSKIVQAQMTSAESKENSHTRSSAHAFEEVLCDMFSDRVILIPSITHASMSFSGGANTSGFHAHTGAVPAGGGGGGETSHAQVLSPHHGTAGSIGSTPQSSSAAFAHPKNIFSPSGCFTINSPGSHISAPHSFSGAVGGGPSGSQHGRYQSMDQWNCEAVSPVLTCLANAIVDDPTAALQLSAVVVEWVVACTLNPLWLDCRHYARKNLFEALVLLLSTAAEKTEKSAAHTTSSEDSVYCLLALQIIRAIAEVLALRGSKPLLEQKVLICLVKAAISAIKVFQQLESGLRSLFVNTPSTVVSWSDLRNVQFRTTVEESCSKIASSLQYYREVFPQPSPHFHQELLDQLDCAKGGGATVAEEDGDDNAEDTSPESDSSSSSDEFSDWDEESEEGEDVVTTTGVSAAADIAHNLGTILWEEMSHLQDLIDQWQSSYSL